MTILKGDVKLVKSQVMDDVPEGGGAPTANVVVDGSSNAIFPDISEVDRAAGRVSARKVHVWVQSDDTDTYMGANLIIAEPPNDPNVSVTMFAGETFDVRTAAISRIEAYLSVGPNYAGFLFGNHINGQATIQIFQRTDDLPAIGSTLALTKREGFPDQFIQYVRVTEASVVLSTFTDAQGDFQRYVLTLKISDPLRADFPGFDVARIDPTKAQLAAATKVSSVIVADAAKYYGVVPLEEGASMGDFSVKATGIFTQLVPSAQIETPIADARSNQLLAGVVSGGGAVTSSVTLAFTTSQSLFVGGAIKPNTLTVVNGAVTVSDSGGRLMSAGTQVGTIDYDNGILSLLTNVFGTSALTFDITYQPAQVPQAVTQSQSIRVTAESRALSYVRTIEPAPVAGTLSVAYMVASRWYVIRDDGSGAIRGPDSGYGAGTVNFTTGTVSVTLGALPDVGSEVIYQWVEPQAARSSELLTLDNGGKFYWPFNTSGVSSLAPGAKSIEPGALTITWNDGTPRTVTDDGAGNLTGYGTGTVNYAQGTFRLSPTTIPAPGTPVNVTVDTATLATASVAIASGSGSFGVTGISPGSVSLTVTGQLQGKYLATPIVDWGPAASYLITDDGAGVLYMHLAGQLLAVGAVDYAAGTFTLNANTVVPTPLALLLTAWDNVYLRKNKPAWAIDVVAS
ncbi:hypothetical protein [Variovorax paradoxus]|uniref:Uncharacterized protein n=1 Tax=Variovorax paradoxus TaxID=34073 RepID=A0A6I6HJB7_VARPD|nr:hypothetical protein [Variovorax paradoxus]QGW82930.1 hypothetical protein GOQ09_15700 [Variovorax paradoxus]